MDSESGRNVTLREAENEGVLPGISLRRVKALEEKEQAALRADLSLALLSFLWQATVC